MKKILFVVSILFLMHTIASAQNNKNRRDSTVVVIFNENKTASEKKKSRKSGEDNVIKIAPLGFISGSFPVYFESEAPDGSFLSASYDYYSYKYSIPRLVVNANGDPKNSGASKSEYENISDLMVHWGYQSVYDKLTLEYTTGIGLRTAKGSKYVGNYDYSTNKITDEGIATYSQTGFNFSIGLKVGYHF